MEYLKNIINEAIKNGGASLDKELKKAELKNGFMVSLMGYEKTYNIKQLESLKNDIIKYQKTIKKNEFIGLWFDRGLIYLDISKHYTKKDKAIKTGIKNKQKAIFDIENNNNIYLTKKTYILYKYIKNINDIIYQKEYNNIQEIKTEFNMKKINKFIYNSIDNIKNLHLLKNKYIIIKDTILINE